MNYRFLTSRFVSALGSMLTTSGALIYLALSHREIEIPQTLIIVSLAVVTASKFVVPRLSHLSTRRILLLGDLGASLFLAAVVVFNHFSNDYPSTVLLPILFILTLVNTVSSASAQSFIAGIEGQGKRMVNADMSMSLLGRVLAPLLAAVLLSHSDSSLTLILLIDMMTYLGSSFLIYRYLEFKEHGPIQAISQNVGGFFRSFRAKPKFWMTVAVTAAAVSAFNAGSIIYVREFGYSGEQISQFLAGQNLSMLIVMLILTKWPTANISIRIPALAASFGIASFALSQTLLAFFFTSSLIAAGMGVIWSVFRVAVISANPNPQQRRFELGILASVISVATILGMFLSQWAAHYIGWQQMFFAGSIAMLISNLSSWKSGSENTAVAPV